MPAEKKPAGKIWRAGTLTYTTGALAVLFCWLLWGDFAFALKERSIPSVLQLLFKRFEASDTLSGFLIGSLPAILTVLLKPVFAYKSDRHRGRLGRRIPFLLLGTPFTVLAMGGLAASPWLGLWLHDVLGARSPGTALLILCLLGFFWALFEVSSVIVNAVFGGLVNDVVPAPLLGRFYGLFRAFSLLAGIVFNYWLFGKAESHYALIFLGMALIYGVGFTMMALKVREGSYPPPPPLPPRETSVAGFTRAARSYFRICFGRPYYLLVFFFKAVMFTATMPPTLFGVYFAKKIGMDMGTFGKCYALTYFISLALAWPLGALADKFHPLRVSLVTSALFMLATLWGSVFANNITLFGVALVAQSVCAGAWMTSAASLGLRLYPRISYAQFASAQGIMTSFFTMLAGPCVGFLLDRTGHDYRLIFLAAALLSLVGLIAGIVLHSRFMKLGGPANYQAPGGELDDS
ncbi:MFS transporter [Geminisphaera colitermitum]|uniref:MFS transporter n=1 Tax=Geminisphaera colitermitum TaxID=1148786 RepID=UPI00019650F8|nr:MFS transporter [Geminisphaera colitermitum]